MKVDFFAREVHHQLHARAIYEKVSEEHRGVFSTSDNGLVNPLVATFSFRDLRSVNRKGIKNIYSDHGTGFYYNNIHPSYAGSNASRENTILRLSPNHRHACKELEIFTKDKIAIVGVPKIDQLANRVFPINYTDPTIGLLWHWDCKVNPETRTALHFFINKIKNLQKAGYKIIGHGHPRILDNLEVYYKRLEIPVEKDFYALVEKVDVLCFDNSSAGFEFAFTRKPVVVLNSPNYRRDVKHEGCPRFWRYADIGPQVDDPTKWVAAIDDALTNHSKYLERIEEMIPDVFTYTDGQCAHRAAEAIEQTARKFYAKKA